MTADLILVVEDDAKSRKLVHDVLEHGGYRIAEATAGDAGVRMARELVTASAMPHDRVKIGAAGFDGYQRKPIDVLAFLAAVRDLLAARNPGRTGDW